MEDKKIVNLPTKHLNIVPLTRQEMHDATSKRISLIITEFANGFDFIRRYPRSVTFFGSTRVKEGNPYYDKAKSLSTRIVTELNYSILTGGGPGIMEAANKGAFESSGQSLGMTIELPKEQVVNPYLTDHIGFYYFFSRKVSMSFCAEAYIFFPGGIGTMDEFFEILTLVQTHKIEKVPMICVGADFWNGILDCMKKEMLERGTVDEEDLKLFTITDDENEILDIIKSSPVRNGIKFDHKS